MTKTTIGKLLVIIGSAKAGTSALAHYLSMHPEFSLGHKKEPKFFTDFSRRDWHGPAIDRLSATLVTSIAAYEENFESVRTDQWAIDASTDYIWCPETPSLLQRFAENSDVRILSVARDPVERAISEYNHTLRHGWETMSFRASVEEEHNRYQSGWHPLFYHSRRSKIQDDIRRFHEIFADRMMVIDYRELAQINLLMPKLCDFMSVSTEVPPVFERKNVSYLPRNWVSGRVLGSEAIRTAGRTVVPARLRKWAWQMLHTEAKNVSTVSLDEKNWFRERMAEEIKRCIADPLIPTDHWSRLMSTPAQAN